MDDSAYCVADGRLDDGADERMRDGCGEGRQAQLAAAESSHGGTGVEKSQEVEQSEDEASEVDDVEDEENGDGDDSSHNDAGGDSHDDVDDEIAGDNENDDGMVSAGPHMSSRASGGMNKADLDSEDECVSRGNTHTPRVPFSTTFLHDLSWHANLPYHSLPFSGT